MQVTNKFDKINYFQHNNYKKAESKPTPLKSADNEKVGFARGLGAFLAANIVNRVIQMGYHSTIGNSINSRLIKYKPNPADKIDEALAKSFENAKLPQKGAQIVDISKLSDIKIVTPDGKELIKTINRQIAEELYENATKHPLTKNYMKLIESKPEFKSTFINMLEKYPAVKGFAMGKNAGFMGGTNKLLINTKEIGYAGFHEIGHAINYNSSKLWKTIQNMRVPLIMVIPSLLTATAFLTNKHTENNPSQTKWGKTKNFIKENVGKLTTLAFVPVVAEEILASVKGQKLAKSILPKHLLKNVTKTNIISASSYIGFAAITGFAAFAGNKVRDLVAHGKQNA